MNLIKQLVEQKYGIAARRSGDTGAAVAPRPVPVKPVPAAPARRAQADPAPVEDSAAGQPAHEAIAGRRRLSALMPPAPRPQPTTRPLDEDTAEDEAQSAAPDRAGGGDAVDAPKVWDLFDDQAEDGDADLSAAAELDDDGTDDLVEPAAFVEVPDPLVPRKTRQAGRVKTRLLGFGSSSPAGSNVFNTAEEMPAGSPNDFPAGWLVVVNGPGRGRHFALQRGISSIGRGPDQTISLDFGDDSISRDKHAAIAYDEEQNACFLGHGGKVNLVRLNGRPVLSTEQLSNADTIRVGETTLRFVELCGADFCWSKDESVEDTHDSEL